MKVVFIDPIYYYVSQYYSVVELFQQVWFSGSKRKPPDPKSNKLRMKKRKLKQLLTTVATLPIIVRCGHNVDYGLIGGLSDVVAEVETNNDHKFERAELIRNTIVNNSSQAFLANFNGLEAVIDSGASKISTFDKNDFVPGTFIETETKKVMKGIAGGLTIEGRGQIRYEVVDSHGVTQTLEGVGLLIKELPCRLMPPQC